jgi:hypothetical protein
MKEILLPLKLESDTIFYEIPALNAKGNLSFREWGSGDELNVHFDIHQPVVVQVGTRTKKLSFSSPNDPIKHVIPVEISYQSVVKTIEIVFIAPFDPKFSENYIKNRKTGVVVFENKPVYELINIVFSLTEKGKGDRVTFDLSSSYYKDVQQHFAKFLSHRLMIMANKIYEPGSSTYRMYRESAYNYGFSGDSIIVSGPYKFFEEGNTILDDHNLWQDFAQQSNFQRFYADHETFYASRITEANKLLPLNKMWQWCESIFPNRYDTYRIVISPLVNGFHSTQRIESDDFNECIMFVCAANLLDSTKYSIKEREGLYSGIVFTEIDHNYINPISETYQRDLDLYFGTAQWITRGSQAESYSDGTGYFNEYMTHAVFLLYIEDHYTGNDSATIKKERMELMRSRGFPMFEEFYGKLHALYKRDMKKDLAAVYPELIKWAREMKVK